MQALYQDAIRKGTDSWYTNLNDVAIILLLACIGRRTGDILGKIKDVRPDLPGLRYNDVELCVQDIKASKSCA